MSLKNLKAKSDEALASIQAITAHEVGVRRPTTAPGATALMQPTIDALNDRAKTAEAKNDEYEKRLQQQPMELSLDVCEEVPRRRRTLTVEQFEELKANLRTNALVHPISVERPSNGTYRIISGHNRVDAYRALGRPSISAVVRDIEAEKVDRSAFYANLLQPSLPDYEKYLGFKQERERTGQKQKQMAEEAGIPESVVSMLLSFDDLPGPALEIIARRPQIIGMSCAFDLAKAARAGNQARVIEAVERLAEGLLVQKDAVKHATTVPSAPRTRELVSPSKVKAGRLDFCQYIGRGTTLRIDFKQEAHRADAEQAIAALLKKLAQESVVDSKF